MKLYQLKMLFENCKKKQQDITCCVSYNLDLSLLFYKYLGPIFRNITTLKNVRNSRRWRIYDLNEQPRLT